MEEEDEEVEDDEGVGLVDKDVDDDEVGGGTDSEEEDGLTETSATVSILVVELEGMLFS